MATGRTTRALLIAAMLGCGAGTASAGFIYVDDGGSRENVSGMAGSPRYNEFHAQLGAIGADAGSNFGLDLGRVLGLAAGDAGTISATFYGSEAGFNNLFAFGGAGGGAIGTQSAPWNVRNVWGPVGPSITMSASGGAALDFRFCAFHGTTAVTGDGVSADGCVSNSENDGLGLGSFQSIGSWIDPTGRSAWLLWDDSGASMDDDYDDVIVRLDYTPVPEPGTLLLTGTGLLALAALRRRRSAAAAPAEAAS